MKQVFVLKKFYPDGIILYYESSDHNTPTPYKAKRFDSYGSAEDFLKVVLSVWECGSIFQIEKIFVV